MSDTHLLAFLTEHFSVDSSFMAILSTLFSLLPLELQGLFTSLSLTWLPATVTNIDGMLTMCQLLICVL